jgi:hypothetical protein
MEGFVFALRQPRKAKDLALAFLATWRFKNMQLSLNRMNHEEYGFARN